MTTGKHGSKSASLWTRIARLAVLAVFCGLCVSWALADRNRHTGNKPELETEEIAAEVSNPSLERLLAVTLTDIPSDSPAYDAARYMVSQGVMQERSENRFDPDSPVTWSELMAVLQRLSGEEPPADPPQFSDAPQDAWYAEAAAWAVSAGIMDSETDFGPDELVTRVQLAQALYRCAGLRGYSTRLSESLEDFRDAASVPDAGKEAMSWALENGLFHTVIVDTIQPGVAVSRLQLAQALVALMRMEDSLAADIFEQQPACTVDSAALAKHDAIQAVVDSAARRYGATSLQVAVVEDGVVTDTYSYGWATVGQDPMTEEHKLRVASISKVAMGMAAMVLREEGAIGLDQDIGTYWNCMIRNPYCPDSPITIRTLLTHTSSVYSAGDTVSCSYSSVRERLSRETGFRPMAPGDLSSWEYSNYGFAILGMTLELASGQNIDTTLKKRLFTAMDIDGAFYAGDIRNTDKLATLYRNGSMTRSKGAQQAQHARAPGASGGAFAGGLTVSAKDLAKLAAMLAEDGTYEGVRVLSEESVALMESHRSQMVPDGFYQAMPLRSRYNIYGRNKLYYHTGSAYGVYNCFSYDPAAKDGVVVLSVGARGDKDENDIYAVCGTIIEYIYRAIK